MLLTANNQMEWFEDPRSIKLVGRKARGLSLIPPAWRPPFVVLSSEVHAAWLRNEADRPAVLDEAAGRIEAASRSWRKAWPRGLILRSSAEHETLEDRGANLSIRLAADLDAAQIREALEAVFRSYTSRGSLGAFAVVIQPLAGEGMLGHISNERRVSPTINQWRWEQIAPGIDSGSFNSWRDTPNTDSALDSTGRRRDLNRVFGAVGRWVTDLKKGPAHLEWVFDGTHLWLVQLDFEFEQPDDGVDPNEWLRQTEHQPSIIPPATSSLLQVRVNPEAPRSQWRKIANVRQFAAVCAAPYPALVSITGDQLRDAVQSRRQDLESDLKAFAHDHAVCRTDCSNSFIARENLPRTNTVSTESAVDKLIDFLTLMENKGAAADEICFLIHQFIPARAGAWVRADPSSPIVRVDALWGLPDGLQYLPHDTFDVDVVRRVISAERVRYKSSFVQETPDGSWHTLKVKRSLGRTRSLSVKDSIAIAITSHRYVSFIGRPQMIMWLCGIPASLGIGTNLPWFGMPPNPTPALTGDTVAPRWPRLTLRTIPDVEAAIENGVDRRILFLDPDVNLFRDNVFIDHVIEAAKRYNCPVQLAGSTLAHAHYQLERAGVSVVGLDSPNRTRVRGRRTFDKLVRGEMPAQIAKRGEIVVQSRLPRSEMRRALVAKLLEEARELLSATDPDDVKGELADLLEVVRAMANVTGVAWSEIETTANEKRESRGGFEDGAVLVGTEWPTPERGTQKAPSIISLRNLGKVVSANGNGFATYNALLSSDSGIEMTIDDKIINIKFTRDGISIVSDRTVRDLPSQLEFKLDDDGMVDGE